MHIFTGYRKKIMIGRSVVGGKDPSTATLTKSAFPCPSVFRLRSSPPITRSCNISRILLKQALIKLCQSGTIQQLQHRINLVVYQIDRRLQQTRHQVLELAGQSLLQRLEQETAEVVALEEVGRGVDAAGEVSQVDAGEAVGCACVAAYAHHVWVFAGQDQDVCLVDCVMD